MKKMRSTPAQSLDSATPTVADLRQFGWQSYMRAPALVRILQALRPHICPVERVLSAVPERSRVFDLGCGTGALLFQLARFRQLQEGLGIDQSASSIATAALVATEFAVPIRFATALTYDEWPNDLFDAVTIIDVMHHVPTEFQDEFFRQAIRRVKPGGTLVYKDMASRPLPFAVWNRVHDLVLARQWINYYPIEQIVRILGEHGFEVQTKLSLRRLAYQHEMIVAKSVA